MRKKGVRVWTETIAPRETRRNSEQIYFHFFFQVLVLLDLLAPSSSLAMAHPWGGGPAKGRAQMALLRTSSSSPSSSSPSSAAAASAFRERRFRSLAEQEGVREHFFKKKFQ